MKEEFLRTGLLIGKEGTDILKKSRIAIFGVGGVGGHVAEALARSGVGTIDLIDHDTVSVTNINRQIIALHSTVGKYKVDVMKDRILDINPDAIVNVHKCFYLPKTSDQFNFYSYDYIVDAVDTVTAKLHLIEEASSKEVKIISSMGAGNKVKPYMFEVSDIYKTSVCPLAKVMRKELKARGIKELKVVYSKEEPVKHKFKIEEDSKKRSLPGSTACVPAVAGLIIASEVINDLVGI